MFSSPTLVDGLLTVSLIFPSGKKLLKNNFLSFPKIIYQRSIDYSTIMVLGKEIIFIQLFRISIVVASFLAITNSTDFVVLICLQKNESDMCLITREKLYVIASALIINLIFFVSEFSKLVSFLFLLCSFLFFCLFSSQVSFTE